MTDTVVMGKEPESKEYITEKDARTVKEMFKKYLNQYKEKDPSVSDQEWLEELFSHELPDVEKKEIKDDASEVVESVKTFDENLKSINEAAEKGVSKEAWLADKIKETSSGMAVQEYGRRLQGFDDILHVKNAELADALTTVNDGEIQKVNMNPNLDGILAENLVAKTTELSGFAQGKNIRVDVLQSNNANSVDVRAINLDTGKYQNYQLKFGKDATHTIKYIEEGNYNNQQIVVPTEQLEEVRAHFKAKGSNKTITDHIDAWGAESKKYTKDDMKEIQRGVQDEGNLPEVNYDDFHTKELALSIGKNAGVMALQSAAVTTGLTIAHKIFKGEKVDPDELVEVAIKTGKDTAVKTVTAGALQVAVRKGVIKFIPKNTSAGVITGAACIGIENVKILSKIASGEMSITKGLDHMGRNTFSMIGGMWASGIGTTIGRKIGTKLLSFIPVIGKPLAVITGFIGGIIGYSGGSKLGEAIYNTGKKVASAAKTVAKAAWEGIKTVGRTVVEGVKNVGRAIASLFGF